MGAPMMNVKEATCLKRLYCSALSSPREREGVVAESEVDMLGGLIRTRSVQEKSIWTGAVVLLGRQHRWKHIFDHPTKKKSI